MGMGSTTAKRIAVFGATGAIALGIAVAGASPALAAEAGTQSTLEQIPEARSESQWIQWNHSTVNHAEHFGLWTAAAVISFGGRLDYIHAYGTAEESWNISAERAAVFSFPGRLESGPIRATGDYEGLCLTDAGTGAKLQACDGSAEQNFRWSVFATDLMTGVGIQPASRPNVWVAGMGANTYGAIAMSEDGAQDAFHSAAMVAGVAYGGPTGEAEGLRPTITGTGHPGAAITVADAAGAQIGTAIVGADGTWSVTPDRDLAEGANEVVVWQDADGRVTADRGTFTTAQPAPTAPLAVTSPAAGDTVTSRTPTLAGTAEPGAAITVTDASGAVLGQTTAGADGHWAVTLPSLADGQHAVTVVDDLGGTANAGFLIAPETGDTPAMIGALAGTVLAATGGAGALLRRRSLARR